MGDEGGQGWEDMTSLKGDYFNVSNRNTDYHAVDFKLHSIILHMYSHLCAKRYTCRGAKCSYPDCILLPKPCIYLSMVQHPPREGTLF